MTTYQLAKEELKDVSIAVKDKYINDKPAIRQAINDYADHLSKHYNFTEAQRSRLSDYCCKLHPK